MKTASSVEGMPADPCRVAACGDLGESHARSAQAPTLQKATGATWSLWVWVLAGFLLLVAAWGAMFTAAHAAKVESVPLATKGAQP